MYLSKAIVTNRTLFLLSSRVGELQLGCLNSSRGQYETNVRSTGPFETAHVRRWAKMDEKVVGCPSMCLSIMALLVATTKMPWGDGTNDEHGGGPCPSCQGSGCRSMCIDQWLYLLVATTKMP